MMPQDQLASDELDEAIRTVLPEEYQDRYEDVRPVSMGSAGLKYAPDGAVAWDEMWGSFCDLAMAGGPPHKGRLLSPGSPDEVAADPDSYSRVVSEICRGIGMVTGLDAGMSERAGWLRMDCDDEAMAGWLLRAITMENVAVRCEGAALYLPAGPRYTVAKEVKNVITAVAKTCHYWQDHMFLSQQRQIRALFQKLNAEFPVVQPFSSADTPGDELHDLRDRLATEISAKTALSASEHAYPEWIGFECPGIRAAIWMMRAVVVSNVLARREETTLFVPVNPVSDPVGEKVIRTVSRVHQFAVGRGVL